MLKVENLKIIDDDDTRFIIIIDRSIIWELNFYFISYKMEIM